MAERPGKALDVVLLGKQAQIVGQTEEPPTPHLDACRQEAASASVASLPSLEAC
jgi:hypothetical protein